MQKSVLGKACLALAALGLASAAACRREEPEPPPVATPSFSVKQTRVPLGSPVEVTYKFVVAEERADHHRRTSACSCIFSMPTTSGCGPTTTIRPIPTTQWKPGQTIEYTKTMFVPVYPYQGTTTV